LLCVTVHADFIAGIAEMNDYTPEKASNDLALDMFRNKQNLTAEGFR
jgi:hypothetical protein